MSNLKKEISLFGGISILAGIMIGSGIFVFASLVLVEVGYAPGLSLLAWLIGGIITLFSGLTYAELGTMFPETGGYYVYLRKAYGKGVAFLSGVMNFVLSSSGSIALLALVFVEIFSYMIPLSTLWIKVIAALIIILLTIINVLGVKMGALIQKIFFSAKLIPLLGIIILGLFFGTETLNLSFETVEQTSFLQFLPMIGFGVVATLWAYEGWTNLNTVAGEMKDVKKDLPRALSIAIGLVTVIYLLFIIALYRLIPYQTLLAVDSSANLPVMAMMSRFGQTGMLIIFISVMVSIFGALNGSTMVFPRVYYAMSLDNTFFKSFQKIHPKYQTPVISIIASGAMAIVLLLFNIRELLTFVVLGGLIFNTLIFISVFIFRKKEKDLERPYQVFGSPYVPIIAIIGLVGLFVATLISSFIPSMIGLGVLLVAFIIYQFIIKKNKAH
ncbi:MAG TPA: amino acid permease [Acholeplasmataceae bacterium]|nr:amino acid permease [Acholeplasmataceae bacterium]